MRPHHYLIRSGARRHADSARSAPHARDVQRLGTVSRSRSWAAHYRIARVRRDPARHAPSDRDVSRCGPACVTARSSREGCDACEVNRTATSSVASAVSDQDRGRATIAVMGPLTGVRVLEFEAIGPGPFCGMLLADMGADVLLVDRARDAATRPRTRALVRRDDARPPLGHARPEDAAMASPRRWRLRPRPTR